MALGIFAHNHIVMGTNHLGNHMRHRATVKFLLKAAWVLELLIALFILLVTVLQMVLTGKDSVHYLLLGQFSLYEFFGSVMSVVVGLEFIKMLVLHTPKAVTDVLLFAIARQLVVSHSSAMETLLGVAAVALIFVVKKFLLDQEAFSSPADHLSNLQGNPKHHQTDKDTRS